MVLRDSELTCGHSPFIRREEALMRTVRMVTAIALLTSLALTAFGDWVALTRATTDGTTYPSGPSIFD